MGRRRKSKPKPAARRKASWRPSLEWMGRMDWHLVKRSSVGLAWLACVAGLVAAWIMGVPRLQAHAAQRGFVPPQEVTIRFVDAPPWLKGSLAEMLTRTAVGQINGDPFGRDDLVAAREALLDTGWFESIEQVRRTQEDLVEVTATFVRPYTVIRNDKGDHLVDVTGKLLPMSYPRGARTDTIAITGTHYRKPHRPGLQWEGADVIAGLKLLQLIDRQAWRSQVTEIDVQGYLTTKVIKLRTDAGSTIVWGGPPGEEPALEVMADGKLQRLDFLYQKHGRIDGNHPGEIDITGEKAVVTR